MLIHLVPMVNVSCFIYIIVFDIYIYIYYIYLLYIFIFILLYLIFILYNSIHRFLYGYCKCYHYMHDVSLLFKTQGTLLEPCYITDIHYCSFHSIHCICCITTFSSMVSHSHWNYFKITSGKNRITSIYIYIFTFILYIYTFIF